MEPLRTIAAVVSALALVVIAVATLRLLDEQRQILRAEEFQSACLRSISANLRAVPGAPQLDCPVSFRPLGTR